MIVINPTKAEWMSPLSFLGASGLFFIFISFFYEMFVLKANRIVPDGYSVCLCPWSYKEGAQLN